MRYLSEFWNFLVGHRNELQEQLGEHIFLTLVALAAAIIIGVLSGILLSRKQKLSLPILSFVNIIQTIPSIALLGFMLPLLGIGAFPAIVALFLYALLPIVRNTFTGIQKIDPAIIEAARGMGMTSNQILQKVEMPLAMPVIFAGIRTAVVINIGVATLCALIAAGGLGEFIFRGIALNNIYMILAGAIPAALLALSMDALFGLIQRYIYTIFKPLLVVFVMSSLILFPYLLWQSLNRPFTAGFPSEFMEREDGYQGLKRLYQLDMETLEMEISLMYQALDNEKVDLISGFSTDGKIKTFNLKTLEDDKNYFPPYYAAPIAYGPTIRSHPELIAVFEETKQLISNEEIIEMNYQVEQFKKSPYEVAKAYLTTQGFATNTIRNGSGDIVVGSKNFTESFILAEIFAILIENLTTLDAKLQLGFGGTKLCFDALQNGEIDIYPEYTGTGFLVILKPDNKIKNQYMNDKDALYQYLKQEFKKEFDIYWLPPLGFNNTFALMMRKEHAERLNIESISDLSSYLNKSSR